MLGNAAFLRRDITEGRLGIPLALTLTIVNLEWPEPHAQRRRHGFRGRDVQ
jgi:hypothetical protein